jgi:hypothetical protein
VSAAKAGAAYFAIAFAAGFALGTLRVLVLAPRLGATGAVLLELPVMLAVSFFAARWTVRRFAVPDRAGPRLAMGGLAFALLILAGTLLGLALFGRTLAAQAATYAEPEAHLGLGAQVLFALMPLVAGPPRRA